LHIRQDGGQAAQKGVRPGDIIIGVNGVHVASAEQMLLLVRTTPRPIVMQLARQSVPVRALKAQQRAEASELAKQRRNSRGAALEMKARKIAHTSPLLQASAWLSYVVWFVCVVCRIACEWLFTSSCCCRRTKGGHHAGSRGRKARTRRWCARCGRRGANMGRATTRRGA
jgi:hypothetical protein